MKKSPMANHPYLPVSATAQIFIELIFESEQLSLWYDQRNFIYAQFRGYHSPFKLKDNSILLLNTAFDLGCSLVLLDARLIVGTWLQAIPWFARYLFPMVARKGVTRTAYVYSPNTFGQRAMERTIEVNTHFEAQAFQDCKTAENWLLGCLDTKIEQLSLTKGKIVIREKEVYSIIELEDILYLFSYNKGTAYQCKTKTYFTAKPLKESMLELPIHFFQTHRSYIVNTQHIMSLKPHDSGSYHVFMKDMPGIKIQVGKKYVPELKNLLNL